VLLVIFIQFIWKALNCVCSIKNTIKSFFLQFKWYNNGTITGLTKLILILSSKLDIVYTYTLDFESLNIDNYKDFRLYHNAVFNFCPRFKANSTMFHIQYSSRVFCLKHSPTAFIFPKSRWSPPCFSTWQLPRITVIAVVVES